MRPYAFFLSIVCLLPLSLVAQTHYVCPPCNAVCDSLTFTQPGDCPHCHMRLQVAPAPSETQQEEPLRIAFYLQDGVEVLDFAGPMEVFAYAGFKVFTVSKTKAPIKSQGILTILPDYSIADAPSADVLAFFGGNGAASAQDTAVLSWIKRQAGVDHYFSVCTGAFFLGNSGLLDGKTVTTFHQSLSSLKESVPQARVLRNVRYVDNGTVITTAGISAGIDGALHFVAQHKGLIAAMQIADLMEYDKWRPGEGLVLNDSSLKSLIPDKQELLRYTGTYAYSENKEVFMVYSEINERLFAVLDDTLYPLYYEGPARFRTRNNEVILFHYDANDRLLGFQEEGREPTYPYKSKAVSKAVMALLEPGQEVR